MTYFSDYILLEGYRKGMLLVQCQTVSSLMTRMEISFSAACDLLDIEVKDRSELLEALQESRKVQ